MPDKDGPQVLIAGAQVELDAAMPGEVYEALADMADAQNDAEGGSAVIRATFRICRLLYGEHYEAFMATRPSLEDITEAIADILRHYGVTDTGESQGSDESSEITSEPSTPTSNVTIASNSKVASTVGTS